MSCQSCNGAGVFKVAYHDGSPTEYALCLCGAGAGMRRATNNGRAVTPFWQVWAHQEGIDPSLVFPAEDILADAEIAALGLVVADSAGDREAALLAAGRKAKR